MKKGAVERRRLWFKSDPKDALVIADVVCRGYYYEYTRQATVFQRLRTIIRAGGLLHLSNEEVFVQLTDSIVQ